MTKALVLYHSQSEGNTGLIANAIADGLKKEGCQVDMHNTNDSRFDITKYPQYDCVAFGSPDYYSYLAGGIKMFIDDHFVANFIKKGSGYTNKHYSLFYTHGMGGHIKEVINNLFLNMGTLVGTPIGCQGKPGNDVLEKAKNLGIELAKSVK
jgi:flavorubredoxin